MAAVNKFITNFMKDNFKQLEVENIKKIYNKDFDILVYNFKHKPNTIIIDKRNSKKTIIYNTLEIASHHILKNNYK
jgi:hypothetical protein